MSKSPRPRSSLREQQLEITRERLLDAALALLARGDADTSLRAVATEAGIAERTLYRHFPTREDLVAALTPRLRERTSEPLPATFDELPEYAARLFGRFEQNAQLVIGMTSSAGLRRDLTRTRSRNLDQLRALVDQAFPHAPAADRASAAASLRVQLSGAGWVYLRTSCGLPADEVLAHARWAIATAAERLAARSGARARRASAKR